MPYTSAEPRSFSAITSIVGISPSRTIRAVVWRPMSRIRLTRKPASATTSSTLPNSDGWKAPNTGMSIHALAPRVAVATREHDEEQRDQQPVDRVAQLLQARVVEARERVHEHEPDAGVDRLAVDVVVGLAVDVARRRALQRDQGADHEPQDGEEQEGVEAQAPLARGERRRRLRRRLDRGRGTHAAGVGER